MSPRLPVGPATSFLTLGFFLAPFLCAQTRSPHGPPDLRQDTTLVGQSPPPSGVDASIPNLEVAPPEAVERSLRKLAGKSVQGANGEKLGTIRDFVIDKKTGAVVYAVVASGGALGIGSTLRLVPIAALQPAPDGAEGYIIKMDRVSWERSPALSKEAFNDGIIFVTEEQRRHLTEAFAGGSRNSIPDTRGVSSPRAEGPVGQATSQEAAAAAPPAGSRAAPRAASPYVRASDLRDKDVKADGEEIGEIEDVIIDLERGRALALVELEDDVIGRELNILIPVEQLDLSNLQRDELASRFTREDFRRLDPSYRVLATTPSVTPGEERLTPTGRTAFPADLPKAAESTLASAARSARQALDQDAELARASITVDVENGALRLRGTVPTEQLKKRAEAAVQQAASGITVENHLSVTPN